MTSKTFLFRQFNCISNDFIIPCTNSCLKFFRHFIYCNFFGKSLFHSESFLNEWIIFETGFNRTLNGIVNHVTTTSCHSNFQSVTGEGERKRETEQKERRKDREKERKTGER